MSLPEDSPHATGNEPLPPTLDPWRLQQAREDVLQAYSGDLMLKRVIWWVCGGIELIAIIWSAIVLFQTGSMSVKLLCVVIALIAHGGMTVVVTWVLLNSLRMDVLRQLKGMELQLAALRTAGRQ